MDNTQNRHYEHTIRMRWLGWTARPVVMVWNFIVGGLCYVWNIVKLTWKGFNESINSKYWLIATICWSISFFFLFIFGFITSRTPQYVEVAGEWVLSPLWIETSGGSIYPIFGLIGVLLAIFPIFYCHGAISGLIKYREEHENTFPEGRIKGLLANGRKTMAYFAVYVLIASTMFGFLYAFSYLGKIGTVGPAFIGILSLPMILASVIIVFISIIISFHMYLAPHLLHGDALDGGVFANILPVSKSLLNVIYKKWLDALIALIPAIFLALLILIIPGFITAGSIDISYSYITDIALENIGEIVIAVSPIETLYNEATFFGYMGAFSLMITASIVLGFLISFISSAMTSIYYYIYNNNDSSGLFKKLVGVFSTVCLPFVVIEIYSAIEALCVRFFYGGLF